MKTLLLSSTPECRRLILIFAGWSSTPELYAGLKAEGWDIMLAYDYTSLSLDKSLLNNYSTIFIIAWSLGVAASEAAFGVNNHLNHTDSKEYDSNPSCRIAAAFAINGTLTPVSDTTGIPEDIFHGTEQNLNPRNLLKFIKRISTSSDPFPYPESQKNIESADIDSLRLELRNIAAAEPACALPWTRAYISASDRIFPARNQKNAWESVSRPVQTVEVEAGHYIPIQKIIDEVTPNLQRIGSNFRKALSTYNSNAGAQSHIASRLISMIPQSLRSSPVSILEIGAGAGTMSNLLPNLLNIDSATFIDLYPLPEFGIAQTENYIVGDAEEAIEHLGDFDLIISASTLQWFADPERFFRNAAKALRPGGMLVCSTFLPGNLRQLDVLRPSPLIYRRREDLQRMLQRYFCNVSLEEEVVDITFKSNREAMLHLKLTGVAGGTSLPAGHSPFSMTSMPDLTTLTYKPLYITATNPINYE